MPFKMKGFSGFKESSPMKKSMGPTEDKIAFEKPAQKRTKKQVRQENRAERKATRKSEGSVVRQALRRGVNKVKAAASNVTQKRVKKKDVVTQTSRKIQAPKASNPGVVKPTVKKTIKKVQTKRGTGNTYKATWEANKDGVQGKYKNYASFEKAAKDYNRAKDASKKYNMPPKEASEYQKRQAQRALNQRKK